MIGSNIATICKLPHPDITLRFNPITLSSATTIYPLGRVFFSLSSLISDGYSPNLKQKESYIKEWFPFAEFIGVNLKEYSDKAHIDMSDGLFIDDSAKNLITSNAKENICFGEIYSWNKEWTGKRMNNWYEIQQYLLEERMEI